MTKNELLQVSDKFLKENVEYAIVKRQRKNGGPYSKKDKTKFIGYTLSMDIRQERLQI